MKNLIVALVLTAMSFTAVAEKSYWNVSQGLNGISFSAQTYWGDNQWVNIAFSPITKCETAYLGIYGFKGIEHVSLMVDDQPFKGAEVQVTGYTDLGSVPYVSIALTNEAMLALGEGTKAVLYTNVEDLDMNLRGSRAALAEAWSSCMEATGQSI